MSYNGYSDEFPFNVKTQALKGDLYNIYDEYGIPPTPPAVANILQEDSFNILTESGDLILQE